MNGRSSAGPSGLAIRWAIQPRPDGLSITHILRGDSSACKVCLLALRSESLARGCVGGGGWNWPRCVEREGGDYGYTVAVGWQPGRPSPATARRDARGQPGARSAEMGGTTVWRL